ncbi:MAG: sigma factor-like helix-turn-helix DNA-binding protein [Alphaproteobacteria bacterium]
MDVIKHSDVSVRLANAIAAATSELPFTTVEQYVRAGAQAKDRFLRLRNLGRRSAEELDQLIHDFVSCEARDLLQTPGPVEQRPAMVREALVSLFHALDFPEVLLDGTISTRLANTLKENALQLSSFSELLRDYRFVQSRLLRLQNCGRKSVAELHATCLTLTGKLFTAWGLNELQANAARRLIFDDEPPSDAHLSELEELIPLIRHLALPYASLETATESLTTVISALLERLVPRERDVVERRYGFGTGISCTLEDIAGDYAVTRERIRQIEAKALRRMSAPRHTRGLRIVFDSEAPAALDAVVQGASYIADEQRSANFRRLSPEVRLAADLLYRDRDAFFRSRGFRWHGGIVLAEALSKKDLDSILKVVKARRREMLLPVPQEHFFDGLDPLGATTAFHLGTDLVSFRGYIIGERASVRRKRTVRLHVHLATAGRPLDIRELLATYHASTPDDPCSVRDAIIVMLDAPHLFLPISDGIWFALGPPALHDEPAIAEDLGLAESAPAALSPEEDSIRSTLRNVLIDRGPLRFVDLRAEAAKRLRGKATSSVGPILLTSGEFIRPLPGIYAVSEQIPSLAIVPGDPPRFLLTEEQARWFAMARYASEPFGRYPLWVPEAEYALCRWAQTGCDPVTFQSLLSVASINQWPVSAPERAHWEHIKRTHGRYGLLSTPRYAVGQLLPPLDRVLACCIAAKHDGRLSWIGANRILKYRLDAHVSAGLLATLIALGALNPAPQWQVTHACGARATEFAVLLSESLQSDGELSWNSTAGQKVASALRSAGAQGDLGWVTSSMIAELAAAAQAGSGRQLIVPEESDETASTYEELLLEAQRAHEMDLAHNTLTALSAPAQ